MLQRVRDLEKFFYTTWASIGSLYACESHPMGEIQSAGKQGADKTDSTYAGGITLNRKIKSKYTV